MKKMYKRDYATLRDLVEDANNIGLQHEDIVGIFESNTSMDRYFTVVFYA